MVTVVSLLLFPEGLWAEKSEPVTVVISAAAPQLEHDAAGELCAQLRLLFSDNDFLLASNVPVKGRVIVVGDFPEMKWPSMEIPEADKPEGFVIKTVRQNRRDVTFVLGADPRGTVYGVYALLEKLGCGFYLSHDALPPMQAGLPSLAQLDFSNAPLVRDRLVFNWHNFLSGCSTWNLDDWKRWILQSQKLGFNAVMVHAYGNNPIFTFDFNGAAKPTGFLATTAKGRDWSTPHVNDVRRMWGGFIFEEPVFGAKAAMVRDEQRIEAAQKLMQSTFNFARDRAMKIYFAVDVDTPSANPRELIETLPPDARFVVTMKRSNQPAQEIWLADPDMPEGYHFYKTQAAALMKTYPQIDCVVPWFRAGGTPWLEMKVSEMPARWQEQYRAELGKTPEAEKFWHSHNMFVLSKIIAAWRKALNEIGHADVEVATGSWRFDFLPACDRFLPKEVKLIGLDYEILNDKSQLRDVESRRVIRDAGQHRDVVPVIWAQHDDGNYIGRPYTPFTDFYSKLADANAAGFGIIHWTTRPLDLFFTSSSRQAWSATKNERLSVTCDQMAAREFGASAKNKMAEYLSRWVTEAPKFARETSDWFIDRKLTNVTEIVAGCESRSRLIDAVDSKQVMTAQRDRLHYFQQLENFIADAHRVQERLQHSREAMNAGNISAARQAITEAHPEQVIEHFARFSSAGLTRGEQGLVVSMNLHWLMNFVSQRQALGVEPVRFNFAPTSHEIMAQSAGTFTFHFDPERNVWRCLGAHEIPGTTEFTIPEGRNIYRPNGVAAVAEEICRTGIESEKPIKFSLRPMMERGGSRAQHWPGWLPAGNYRVSLFMIDPVSTAAGQRVFDISVGDLPAARIDIFQETGQRNSILEKQFTFSLRSTGQIEITASPVAGKALLCGVIAEPATPSTETTR